jgi:glycosyltransferase involved in cell wall biosynthesis
VPAGDAEALANRLAALLRDPEQARRVGEEARRTVDRRFTMPQVADQWLSVYQRVRRAS